jgi:hypothetical protein
MTLLNYYLMFKFYQFISQDSNHYQIDQFIHPTLFYNVNAI